MNIDVKKPELIEIEQRIVPYRTFKLLEGIQGACMSIKSIALQFDITFHKIKYNSADKTAAVEAPKIAWLLWDMSQQSGFVDINRSILAATRGSEYWISGTGSEKGTDKPAMAVDTFSPWRPRYTEKELKSLEKTRAELGTLHAQYTVCAKMLKKAGL